MTFAELSHTDLKSVLIGSDSPGASNSDAVHSGVGMTEAGPWPRFDDYNMWPKTDGAVPAAAAEPLVPTVVPTGSWP